MITIENSDNISIFEQIATYQANQEKLREFRHGLLGASVFYIGIPLVLQQVPTYLMGGAACVFTLGLGAHTYFNQKEVYHMLDLFTQQFEFYQIEIPIEELMNSTLLEYEIHWANDYYAKRAILPNFGESPFIIQEIQNNKQYQIHCYHSSEDRMDKEVQKIKSLYQASIIE